MHKLPMKDHVATCARYLPPPLRKHQESQENDGETGSRCLAII